MLYPESGSFYPYYNNTIPWSHFSFFKIIYLHKTLRSKVKFLELRIYSKYHPDICGKNITFNSWSTREKITIFTFCGIYNNFTYFPHGNKVSFRVSTIYFELEMMFDIIALNVIKYSKLEHTNKLNTEIKRYSIALVPANIGIVIYHIVVEKINHIFVKVKNAVYTLVYDGPGFLSNKVILQQKGVNFKSSSFQLVIQIIKHFHDENHQDQLYRFISIPNKEREEILMETKSSVYIFKHDSKDSFKHNNSVCVQSILFTSQNGSYVNVSITNFIYGGITITSCQYGGISFFDHNLESIASICTKRKVDAQNLQNVYSNENKLFIVIFSFHPYSSLRIQVKVSVSMCKVIKIDACQNYDVHEPDYSFDVTAFNCTLVQVSAKLVDSLDPDMKACQLVLSIKKFDGPVHYYYYYASEYISTDGMYFKIAGRNYIYDKNYNILLYEWQKRTKHLMNIRQHQQNFVTDDPWFLRHDYSQLININTKNGHSKSFKVILKTWIPTTDDLLRFRFKGIKGRNWVDIYFGPEMNPNKTVKNQFDAMVVGTNISLFNTLDTKRFWC